MDKHGRRSFIVWPSPVAHESPLGYEYLCMYLTSCEAKQPNWTGYVVLPGWFNNMLETNNFPKPSTKVPAQSVCWHERVVGMAGRHTKYTCMRMYPLNPDGYNNASMRAESHSSVFVFWYQPEFIAAHVNLLIKQGRINTVWPIYSDLSTPKIFLIKRQLIRIKWTQLKLADHCSEWLWRKNHFSIQQILIITLIFLFAIQFHNENSKILIIATDQI